MFYINSADEEGLIWDVPVRLDDGGGAAVVFFAMVLVELEFATVVAFLCY